MAAPVTDQEQILSKPPRPSGFDERYRLYLDESGDHVFRDLDKPQHRFLCLMGCWFHNVDYLSFHDALANLKARYFPHHPDEPIILHREDCRSSIEMSWFWPQ